MKPLFAISSDELRECPVLFAVKLHDGRLIWTTGKFVEGSIQIETPRAEEFSTFGDDRRYRYVDPFRGFSRTDIDVTLKTDQIGWKEGEPQWEPLKQLGDGNVAENQTRPVDLDVRGGTLPVQEIRNLPKGSGD